MQAMRTMRTLFIDTPNVELRGAPKARPSEPEGANLSVRLDCMRTQN